MQLLVSQARRTQLLRQPFTSFSFFFFIIHVFSQIKNDGWEWCTINRRREIESHPFLGHQRLSLSGGGSELRCYTRVRCLPPPPPPPPPPSSPSLFIFQNINITAMMMNKKKKKTTTTATR
eukprot:gene4696-3389_t